MQQGFGITSDHGKLQQCCKVCWMHIPADHNLLRRSGELVWHNTDTFSADLIAWDFSFASSPHVWHTCLHKSQAFIHRQFVQEQYLEGLICCAHSQSQNILLYFTTHSLLRSFLCTRQTIDVTCSAAVRCRDTMKQTCIVQMFHSL